MRLFLIVAFSLITGTAGHAQYFSFNTGGGPIEIDVPRGYVRVPGYVELGPRPYYPPPPAYYDPPPRVYYGPPRGAYYPPRGAPPPEIFEEDDEPVFHAPPRRYEPPRIRQPRQMTSAPKKKPLPKVAAVRDASPSRAPVNRAIAPVQAPLPPSPAASAPAAPLSQPDIGGAQQSAPASVTQPPVAATPAPSSTVPTVEYPPPPPVLPPVAAAPPAIAPTPAPAAPRVSTPEPQKSLLERASPPQPAPTPAPSQTATPPLPTPPQIAAAPAASPPPEKVQPRPAPPAAAIATPPAATPALAPRAEPPAAAKPANTVVAALPPARQETEEKAKSTAMPVGTWSSSDGQMRVQPCGKNLCGYAVGGRHAGKMVLIQMRQTRDNHWSGQVNDVRSGQNYSASMSMRGPNSLNITGCALGGLFCGSRTMSRVQ